MIPHQVSCSSNNIEHSSCLSNIKIELGTGKTSKGIISTIGETRKKNLTPKKEKLYHMTQIQRDNISSLKRS